jgi:hypothetical protein
MGYSPSHPWLFEDFDQISFYNVSEEGYEKQLALFHSGQYDYQIESVTFDMKEHKKLLKKTADDVAQIRKRQKQAQDEMEVLERETMDRWMAEKAKGEIPKDTVSALMNGQSGPRPS